MKKLMMLLVAVVMCCAGASAQNFLGKGKAQLGFNLGVIPCLESHSSVTNFDFGAFGRYNFTRQFRGEIAFNYSFKDKGVSDWDLGANLHYLAPVSRKVALYPLVGVGVAHVMWDGHDWEHSKDKFMFNVGMGVQCALTSNLSMGAEIKYQYIQDFNRLPILVNVAYTF